MTLAAGARLGPYEILSPLGAGGMGEVWRARDSRLSREVAIKVLPAAVASDPERLKRFEKEARSASALNHPAIVTIYDVGVTNGVSWIAMELVDGKTLRELLASGALPVKRLLQFAVPVADGLARAHEAGIVHRDMKPENVMVGRDGFVKILDFGLVKLSSIGSGSGEGSHLPTMTGTSPGVVVGTVGYMSPEQASGEALDFRSDQFSFGSVLYEMATGKRAFQKKTAIDTLGAILNEEPQPIAATNPQVPAPLRWIVERCLSKEPEDRYGTTRDLARDLATVRDHLSETSGITEVAPAVRRRSRILPAVLSAAALALGLLAGKLLWKGDAPALPRFQQLTFRRGVTWNARFAPDGHTIVYAARWDGKPGFELFSTRPESPESRSLGLPPAVILSISSAGQMAFKLHRDGRLGKLAEAPLAGGAARELLDDVEEADWSPDGKQLAVSHYIAGKIRIEFPIGNVIHESPTRIADLRVAPNGKWITFREGSGPIHLLDVSGKEKPRQLGPGVDPVWSLSGEEIYFLRTGGTLSQTELCSVALSGRVRTILRLPGTFRLYDISPDGRFLMERVLAHGEIFGRAPGETTERPLSWLDFSKASDLSSDGRYVLIEEPGHGVYLRKTDGSEAVRLGEGHPRSLSPDGKWALCVTDGSPPQLILLPTGAGRPRTLTTEGFQRFDAAGWFPDGQRVWFNASEAGRPARAYAMDLDQGKPRPILLDGVEAAFLSPDGAIFVANGPDGTAFYPAGGGPSRPIPGLTEGDRPIRWSSDGRALFVAKDSGNSTRVHRLDMASGHSEFLKELSPSDPTGVLGPPDVLLSADGKSWVYSYYRDLCDLYLLDGVR
ncbi:MAG: protein kinase [Thermoanaerobaculia bacterium]